MKTKLLQLDYKKQRLNLDVNRNGKRKQKRSKSNPPKNMNRARLENRINIKSTLTNRYR